MNLDKIIEKIDRLEERVYMSRRPIHYVDHYDRYQPNYQDTIMEATQFNQKGQGWHQSNFGDQWYDHEQMSDQNRGYTSWNNQSPSYDSYDPQEYNSYAPHEYNNYAPQEYNNYASQQQFDNFQQWEGNSDESPQDNEIMSMFKQLLEVQESGNKEISEMKAIYGDLKAHQNDLNSKFEGLVTRVKGLENQIAQAASTSEDDEDVLLPGKLEENPKECCQEITLRNGNELPSGDITEGKTEKLEEEELPVDKEAENEVLAEDKGSEKKEEKQAQEAPKTEEITEEKTEHLPPYDKRGTEEEASNSKTSMESEGEAEKQDDWSILKTPNTEVNESTLNNHFPWPFTDQMLSIFSDLIENVVEMFRNCFSIYGYALVSCLSNLCRALKRYEGTTLVLNWKKCHFMEREGTIHEPITSKEDIEVDKEKAEVIVGLELPTAVKEVISSLLHANFHKWPFEDSSRDVKPFVQLLCKGTKIKNELVNGSIVQANDWSFPFEPGGDFTVKITA